jgi:TATA element modulatory factor
MWLTGSGAWGGMPDFMGFMGQQSQQKGNEDAEMSTKPQTLEHSTATSKEDNRASTEETIVSSTEEKTISPLKIEEPELIKNQESAEETVPPENIPPVESVETDKEKDGDEVDQPEVDSEKEVSEVIGNSVPSQETVEETKISGEGGEATTESGSKETSDDNVDRETEVVAAEIAPDVSDNAPSGELRHESKEKLSAVITDIASEEVINHEPPKTLIDASDIESIQEEHKRDDTEKEEKKEEGETAIISHDFSESNIELEKLRKEMKMMEAALQGAARQAQVLDF